MSVSQQVDEVMGVLAERFGSTAQAAFAELVAYERTMGVVACSIYFVLSIAFLVAFAKFAIAYKNSHREEHGGGAIAFGGLFLVGLALCVTHLGYALFPIRAAMREVMLMIG